MKLNEHGVIVQEIIKNLAKQAKMRGHVAEMRGNCGKENFVNTKEMWLFGGNLSGHLRKVRTWNSAKKSEEYIMGKQENM